MKFNSNKTNLINVVASWMLFFMATLAVSSASAADVAAGGFHTCAITNNHQLKCWGQNYAGQLGNGTLTDSATPVTVDIAALGSATVQDIAAGGGHSCLIDSNHLLYCWGWNFAGQLGIGNQTDTYQPTLVTGLGTIREVALAPRHSCAIKTDGTLWCWGTNEMKQLGVPSPSYTTTPMQITGLQGGNALKITVNFYETCVLMADNSVWCWGDSDPTKRQIQGLTGNVKTIALGGSHMCALLNNGQVMCWGSNTQGELGTGNTLDSAIPITVPGLSNVRAIVAAGFTCALTGGEVWCWGSNSLGQLGLGDDDLDPHPVPTKVPSLSSVISLSSNAYHVCAMRVTGELHCWGDNRYGQIGNGAMGGPRPPGDVVGMDGAATVNSGGAHSCAIGTNHVGLWCWGNNKNGQLGDGSTQRHLTPITVQGTAGVTVDAVGLGDKHTCAAIGGKAKCWGDNTHGQLGDNSTNASPLPITVQGPTNVVGIAAGMAHSCAFSSLNAGGNVWCWGANDTGQLGIGSTEEKHTAQQIPGLSNVTTLIAGDAHICAIINNDTVSCWGDNMSGQLGNGTAGLEIISMSPTAIANFSGITHISAGWQHTCARDANNQGWCWGRNDFGQLGVDFPNWDPTLPHLVPNLPTILAISAGEFHNCGLTITGMVWCWGSDSGGQISGTRSFSNPLPAQQITGLSNINSLDAGRYHTCVVIGSGANSKVSCWGSNSNGQLGNGAADILPSPQALDPQIIIGPDRDPIFASNFEL